MTTPAIDEGTYRRLVEPHRRELHAHCYRLLGSSEDAEEALQEALLRAWRGFSRFEGRSTVRSWLYSISTNACMDALDRRKRVVPIDWAAGEDQQDAAHEPADEGPGPEALLERRDDLEQALGIAFAHLTPQQRVVLVLRTALGFRAAEAASLLGTSVASVNSALQRARRALAAAPDDAAPAPAPAGIRRCAEAIARGETSRALALLGREPAAAI